MPRPRRLLAALALALLCAPGTWLRSPTVREATSAIDIVQIQGKGATPSPAWRVAGVWQYRADNLLFGGFSALLALKGDRLRAFSDRGARLTLTEPDRPGGRVQLARQLVAPNDAEDMWDIEAATRNPANGTYWLAYEAHHAIYRFAVASKPDGKRDLKREVDWSVNSGAEAMVRLPDGRFMLMPEGEDYGIIYPSDPVAGGAAARFAFRNPAADFVVTDAAALPDGRLLVLMRDVTLAYPPFRSLIAIGAPPKPGGVFAPEVLFALERAIPRENYEGMAIRPRADGLIDVWLMADDNLSVMQRSLLAKLVFDPALKS